MSKDKRPPAVAQCIEHLKIRQTRLRRRIKVLDRCLRTLEKLAAEQPPSDSGVGPTP